MSIQSDGLFASGARVSRTFQLTGRIKKIYRKTRYEWNILITPTDKFPAAGIWLTGRVPADRDPDFSVYAGLRCRWIYTFDVVATGNLAQIPSHGYRIDFHIMRVYNEPADMYGACLGDFGITGTVMTVHPDYIVIKTDALPASQKRTALPAYYMALRIRKADNYKFWPGRFICAHVRVSPGMAGDKYVPFARIDELAMFMDTPKNVIKTFERRGHWRTGANGAKHWVRPCTVHRLVHG